MPPPPDPNKPPTYNPVIRPPQEKENTSTSDPTKQTNWQTYKRLGAKIARGGGLSALTEQELAEWTTQTKRFDPHVNLVQPDPTPSSRPDPTAAASNPPKPTAPDIFQQQLDNTTALNDQLPPPKPPSPSSQTDRTNDVLDEAMGITPPPPPDRLGESFGDSAGGQPLDVNIVGPLPIPVLITNWDEAAGDGSGGGGGDGGDGRRKHRDAYGIDEQEDTSKPLAGQTVQEGFAKFAGGYAAGYPIHNLAQLGKNLGRIGRGSMSALNQMTGGALGAGLSGIGKMVAGSRLGKAASRGLSTLAAKLEKKKYGVTGASKLLARGTGAAATAAKTAGMASGAGGMAAAGGAAAAMAGPAAAVAAFGAALVSASQEVYSFARAQEETIRTLSEYNATLAHAAAELDIGRLERDIRLGEATEGTGREMLDSMDRFEESLAPIQEAATNLANMVGGALLDVITGMATVITPMAEAVTAAIHWWRGTTAPAPTGTAWDIFADMAADLDAAGRRSWPGAGSGPPAGWGGS
jgi:hypothetical protein